MIHEELKIVLDIGSYETRCGFSTNKKPTLILPSSSDPLSEPIVAGSAKYDSLVSKILFKHLQVDPREKNLLVTECVFNSRKNRVAVFESFFENFNAAKVALVPDSTCALYSHITASGAAASKRNMTGLLVGLGHARTSIVPFVEGHIVQNGISEFQGNGQKISRLLSESLSRLNPDLDLKSLTSAVSQIKTNKCSLVSDPFRPRLGNSKIEVDVEGKKKSLQIEELALISPHVYFEPQIFDQGQQGLGSEIAKSLARCPFDVKASVFANLVVFGGSSQFEGMKNKLQSHRQGS